MKNGNVVAATIAAVGIVIAVILYKQNGNAAVKTNVPTAQPTTAPKPASGSGSGITFGGGSNAGSTTRARTTGGSATIGDGGSNDYPSGGYDPFNPYPDLNDAEMGLFDPGWNDIGYNPVSNEGMGVQFNSLVPIPDSWGWAESTISYDLNGGYDDWYDYEYQGGW